MKTFEEKFTAWVDGNLPAAELAAFEREMATRADRESLESDSADPRAEVKKLGALLRSHNEVPALTNPDFFNHQILHRISLENRESGGVRRWWKWSLPQLAWTGAACLLMAAALFSALIPSGSPGREHSPYFAEIVDVRSSLPGVYATPVYDAKDNVTVVWLDGLDYLPATYKLQ